MSIGGMIDKEAGDHVRQVEKTQRQNHRANVVLELINSERDYVKHLKDVVEGYLYPSRRHPEIFTSEKINTIFANIEQLYEFQRNFLGKLESCINWDDLAASQVGKCFLDHEKDFSVYYYYCNNHPNATSELQELYTKTRFVEFFEACRVLQNMIDISLDGFLLTPIQKICKYPLQLKELLKNTNESHPDHKHVINALETMRNCANLANERKRRIEALADVMSFQEKFENWFGPKISESSSILIHSAEVLRMNVANAWSQNVQLYLFDHLLLYAKKDILLKRSELVLKGRICMDTVTEISDADEYKPKRSFKLYCREQEKWFVFITRTEKEKDEWIQAFERERNLVELDESEGFQITDREISIARRAVQHRKHSLSARYQRHKQRPDTAIVDQIDLDDANMIMNRTLSLPSCIHPSHVMNFVEDSKVVSKTSRNSGQYSPSSRSPGGHNHSGTSHAAPTLNATDDQHPDSKSAQTVNWFKKVGSKKLAKSQVYTINDSQSTGSSQLSCVIPRIVASSSVPSSSMDPLNSTQSAQLTGAQTITSDKAAIKYEELEKRHREHMSSEEQARLYRLNNDLPPPPSMFGPQTGASSSSSSSRSRSARWSGGQIGSATDSVRPSQIKQTEQRQQQQQQRMKAAPTPPMRTSLGRTRAGDQAARGSSQATNHHVAATGQDLAQKLRAVGLDDGKTSNKLDSSSTIVNKNTSSSFETTLVLSSGRVVKVREDTV